WGKSDDQVEAQLGEVVFQRMMAERLVENLRSDRDSMALHPAAAEQEALRLFYAEPDAHTLREEIRKDEEKLNGFKRVARVGNDSAVRVGTVRLRDHQDRLARLWQERKPILMAELTRAGTNEEVRNAESQLKVLIAKEEALRATLAEVKK